MRDKWKPLLGAVAAGGLMILLFKPDAAVTPLKDEAGRGGTVELEMPDLSGAPWKLSDHRGKVVLVNFWATWCPPCRTETPALVRIAQEYEGRVEIAGISLDEGLDEVRRFAASYDVPYPILIPPPGDALTARIQSLPTTLLIDRRGRVAKTYMGAEPERVFRRDIDRLLAELPL